MSQPNVVIPMIYHSKEHVDAVASFEQEVRRLESIPFDAGLEHLAREGGDRGLLCYRGEKPVGLLSWYTSDGAVASINARVHPHYHRQGVFRDLLRRAKKDIEPLGIRAYSYRVPQGSAAGEAAARSLGAAYQRSEYSMTVDPGTFRSLSYLPADSGIWLLPAAPQDFEFMVACLSQAFGDSVSWTRDYLARTSEPNRANYLVWLDDVRVGLIRVNRLSESTAVIHDFCILPSYQGKKLGTQALRTAVDLLLGQSFDCIRLGVVTDNERALNLYRGAGFAITAEYKYYLEQNHGR